MTKSNIVINGCITTVQPLSIKMPDNDNDFESFPVMTRGIDEDGKLLKTGYLPATTLRGFLRRAVVVDRMVKAAADGKPYSLQKAYSELIGQDSDSEKQADEIDLLEIKKLRESSPVLDLFGSGLGVASRLRVGHFVPETNVCPEFFTQVRKDLDATEEVLDSLSDKEAKNFFDREAKNRSRSIAEANVTKIQRAIRQAKQKKEPVDELKAQLKEADKLVEKYKNEMGDMKVSTKAIFRNAALPAGIDLFGRLVILNSRPEDLEMIEFALDYLSRSPVLGAQSARGCGEIKGSFEVLQDGKLIEKITVGDYSEAKIDRF